MFTRLATLLALGALLVPIDTVAQIREVQAGEIRIFADGGGLFPLRTFSGNQANVLDDTSLQVGADIQATAMIGGGLEYALTDPSVRIRASYRQSVGMTSDGNLLNCGFGPPPQDPLFPLCEESFEVDGTVREVLAEVVFVQGTAGNRVRPTIHFGVGFRGYDFTSLECDGVGDVRSVCESMADIWEEEAAFNPILTVGLGFDFNLGGPMLFLQARGMAGQYKGGRDQADGDTQTDTTVIAGLSFPLKR